MCLHELTTLAMTSLVNTGYQGIMSVTAELPLSGDGDIIVQISMGSGEQTTADHGSGYQPGCQQPSVRGGASY